MDLRPVGLVCMHGIFLAGIFTGREMEPVCGFRGNISPILNLHFPSLHASHLVTLWKIPLINSQNKSSLHE